MAAGIAVITFSVYLRSLMPGLGFSGDSAKWATISKLGGVPHETGYPLYVALIQAFDLVPFGSPAWRTNLLSAVFAVMAVVALYWLLRSLGTEWRAAAATSLTFAFTTTFWMHAVVAEVYTLHILFMAGILGCLVRWRFGHSDRWLLAAIGLTGLSFGNQMGTVLVLPAIGYLALSQPRRALTLRHALFTAAVGVLGTSQYLYLLYMTKVGGHTEVPVHDLGDLWAVVRGGKFRHLMFAFSPGELLTVRLPQMWRFLLTDYLLPLLIPVAVGVLALIRSKERVHRDIGIALLLVGGSTAAYAINFDISDVFVYYLPLYLVLAVFLGIGLDRLAGSLAARIPGSQRLHAGLVAGVALVPLITCLVDYPRASQRGNVNVMPWAAQVVDAVGDHAVVLTNNYNEVEFLDYYLRVHDGHQRDIKVLGEVPAEWAIASNDGRGGPVADAVGGLRAQRPAHVFTLEPDHVTALTRAGVPTTRVGPEVWRVDPVGTAGAELRPLHKPSGSTQ